MCHIPIEEQVLPDEVLYTEGWDREITKIRILPENSRQPITDLMSHQPVHNRPDYGKGNLRKASREGLKRILKDSFKREML